MTRAIRFGSTNYSVDELLLRAPGKGHDKYLVRDDFVAVADGSTPLGSADTDAETFAAEALHQLYEFRDRSTNEMFEMALASLKPESVAGIAQVPSCTVGVLRVWNGFAEAAVLGDCCVAVRAGGELGVVEDRRLEAYDTAVAQTISDMVRAGSNLPDARRAVEPQLIANRNRANKSGTYWLFSGDPRAASQVRRMVFACDSLRSAILFTDGITRAISPFGLFEDVGAILNGTLATGLEAVGRAISSAEARDPDCSEFPRLSAYDDKAAVLLDRGDR